jgi:hypothetical protein
MQRLEWRQLEKVHAGWKKKVLSTIFSKQDEEEHNKRMHMAYLPANDLLFGMGFSRRETLWHLW